MDEFYIDSDVRLHAKLERPGSFEHGPLAIVLHGLTGHMEERHIVAVSKTLNELGVATLRVELYGHGQSGGDFCRHTLYKWIGNVLEVIDYAKGLPFADELYLCGHSQGGLTSMLVAGMRPYDIRALMPLSPAIVIVDGARKGSMLGMTFDPAHIPDQVANRDRKLSGNYFRVAQTIDVDAAIARYHGPVLLVHGAQDMAVPVSYSIEAADKYEDARLVLVEGDTHCYTEHLDRVLDAIRAFVRDLQA
ncbi:MAG: alpha/beta hydrolase [Atopobiaceae bacterium]|nr:alpha/beta hydrolase [Atopobiaceae bacterium]